MFTDTGIPLDDRILSVLVPPGAVVIVYFIFVTAWRRESIRRRAGVIAIAIPWLLLHAWDVAKVVAGRTDESELTWTQNRRSPTLDEIRKLPADAVIITNHARLVYWITHRLNEDLPTLPGENEGISQEEIVKTEIDKVRELIPQGGWIVYAYGHNLDGLDDPCLTEANIRTHFHIAEERLVADGVLLRIDDPALPPNPSGQMPTLALGEFEVEQTDGGKGQLAKEPDSTRFDIAAVDGIAWHVQACLRNLDFRDGEFYTVTFSARASDERTIDVAASIDQEDWHTIGLEQTVHVSKEWREYTYTFQASRTAGGNNVLAFILGDQTGQVWLKALRVSFRSRPPH